MVSENQPIFEYVSARLHPKERIRIQGNLPPVSGETAFGFGSSIRMDFVPEQSDVDLLVQIDISDPLEKGEALLGLWDALEAYFQRKVDLMTPDSLCNPFLKASIEKNKQLIYEG